MTDLDRVRDALLDAYARAGHPIRAPVRIVVRPELRATATSFRNGDEFLVLVRADAAESGAVGGLLAHELGHVQRMDAGHPSHDDEAITAAYEAVPSAAKAHAYQREVLHHVINFTQDLYADPLGLRVARDLGLLEPGALDALVARFANDEPYEISDPRQRRWDQAEDMVGNARAITLARLAGAKRGLDAATRAQERYLTRIPADIAREAPWFQRLFDEGLPEETTRERFTATLVEYVRRFVATAEGAG